MSAPRAPARWPLALTLLLLAAALGTLVWLRGRVAEQRREALENARDLFARTGVLGRPEGRAVRFAELETLAATIAAGDLVEEVRVRKLLPGGEAATVVPFDADAREPGWDADPRWLRFDVGDPPAGRLYIRVDRSGPLAVDAVIALLLLTLAGGLAVLAQRQRGKERQLLLTESELEARRAEVVRLERLALVGQLSANIFHDLRKPVLNIRHEAQDALDGIVAPDAEWLRDVQRQADLFVSILRDLGVEDFARARGDEAEWCDLRDCVERARRLVKYEQRDTAVEIAAPEESPLVFAPAHRLVQLVGNLLLNAYQAMEGRGRVRVAIAAEDGALRLAVEDDGPGVPEALRATLFDAFQTTRHDKGGSGLGLYICRKIADDLGGTLELRESPLGGAAFVLRLPAGRGR